MIPAVSAELTIAVARTAVIRVRLKLGVPGWAGGRGAGGVHGAGGPSR